MGRRVRVGAYAVCREGGAILLVHQVAPGPAQDRWTLPGGGVDFGESPADAVRREVAEETGLDVTLGPVIAVHDNVYEIHGETIHGVRLLFQARVTGTPTMPDPTEIDAVSWHRVDHLPAGITAWAELAARLP